MSAHFSTLALAKSAFRAEFTLGHEPEMDLETLRLVVALPQVVGPLPDLGGGNRRLLRVCARVARHRRYRQDSAEYPCRPMTGRMTGSALGSPASRPRKAADEHHVYRIASTCTTLCTS